MQTAKDKITQAVDIYIAANPEEFAVFQEAMVKARESLADERFGEAKDTQNRMRALFEMPVALHELIHNTLSEEETAWFKEGGANKREGARWFARTFPAFRIPHSV